MLKLDIEQTTSTVYMKNRADLHSFAKVVSKPFENLFLPVVRKLHNQIFLQSSEGVSVDNHARPYGLERSAGESDQKFIDRILMRKLLLRNCSASTIFFLNLSVLPRVIRVSDKPVFTVGVTPLGTGVSVNSLYRTFMWEAVLPDLSDRNISDYLKKKIRKQLDHLFPSIQINIFEDRPAGKIQWEV